MNDKEKAARAARRTAVVGILSGLLIFAYGLWVSRSHITHIGHWLGLSRFEAETLFILVDFLALYGKVLTSKRLSAKTRRYGFKVMLLGLALSTGCNVGSGLIAGTLGGAGYGVFLVVIIVIVEYGVSITKAKTASPAAPRTTVPQPTPRQTAARKAAETRKRNATAPVSPGVGPVGDYVGPRA